jgi:hypothetical protein
LPRARRTVAPVVACNIIAILLCSLFGNSAADFVCCVLEEEKRTASLGLLVGVLARKSPTEFVRLMACLRASVEVWTAPKSDWNKSLQPFLQAILQ